jgi:hypothetical protein
MEKTQPPGLRFALGRAHLNDTKVGGSSVFNMLWPDFAVEWPLNDSVIDL